MIWSEPLPEFYPNFTLIWPLSTPNYPWPVDNKSLELVTKYGARFSYIIFMIYKSQIFIFVINISHFSAIHIKKLTWFCHQQLITEIDNNLKICWQPVRRRIEILATILRYCRQMLKQEIKSWCWWQKWPDQSTKSEPTYPVTKINLRWKSFLSLV